MPWKNRVDRTGCLYITVDTMNTTKCLQATHIFCNHFILFSFVFGLVKNCYMYPETEHGVLCVIEDTEDRFVSTFN